ncbi:AAA family ATPase [Desulfobacter curvatus]|uniref:bifunctional aminoglycoside phosphotransferase/ATP-binding protein n=1 Tax=Desulfobacter curvatus TaxID=2290 RepID=UPI00037C5FDC|nr:bifunctional aminoglycoside phosphotransferase/ATP-binding protein [Desulfobacter curvatus]
MRESALQETLFKQMRTPEFYPHPVHSVTVCETHISMVFLAGDVVYKIKKSVGLEFLDFTTLENRRHFCTREVALNRRLTNNVYLGVTKITQKGNHFYLNGDGTVVEYAVRMRRLSETDSMKQLLRSGKIGNKDIDRLAMALSEFYGSDTSDNPPNMETAFETIRQNCDENFKQAQPLLGPLFDGDCFQSIWSRTGTFLNRQKPLFFRRMGNKRFRNCHGDLRTGHIYFTDTGIQIIDCIEFNDRFRYQDVGADLAFLAMDMEFLGFSALAEKFLLAYAGYSHDPEVYVLINFYKCYRAIVRFKVNCIRLQEHDVSEQERNKLLEQTKKYLALADRYADRFSKPRIWVVCGMPASGKSSLAQALSLALNIRSINSDEVRKKIFSAPPTDPENMPFEKGMYSETATGQTYDRLLSLAEKEVLKGNSVVLDATFSREKYRKQVVSLAKQLGAGIVFTECTVPDPILQKRLIMRNGRDTISDARISHFQSFKNRFEPIRDTETDHHIKINTESSMDACLSIILPWMI